MESVEKEESKFLEMRIKSETEGGKRRGDEKLLITFKFIKNVSELKKEKNCHKSS